MTCLARAGKVDAASRGTVLGYPACVYGFFMYALIVLVAAIGLARQRSA